jgi:hypothetical protein
MAPGTTNKANLFSTAKAFVCFQTRPGIGNDKVIQNAGSATLKIDGKSVKTIAPTNGQYPLPIKPGEAGIFTILDFEFHITASPSAGTETTPAPAITVWQSPMFPINSIEGVQQRLQILGYYTGRVDGMMGRLTEKAVLEFQADQGTLVIDGDPGPLTKNALDSFFNTNGYVSGTKFLFRRYFISATRAKTGPASWDCPHPDARGGTQPIVPFGLEQPAQGIISTLLNFLGMVSPAPERSTFKVKFEWTTGLAARKSLFAVVNSGGTPLIVANDTLSSNLVNPLLINALSPGDTQVELHYGSQTGTTLALLDVKIVALVQIGIAIHIVNIKDAHGNSVPNLWNYAAAESLMADINAIWLPLGIDFKIRTNVSHTIIGEAAGTITNHIDSHGSYSSTEFYPLWHNNNSGGVINVYFANDLVDIVHDATGKIVSTQTNKLGYALSRQKATPTGFVGVCVKHSLDTVELARTVAHELGHILHLTKAAAAHSDDDGTDMPYRHDIWSRTRLMSKYSGYYDNYPVRRTWQDNSYGKAGSLMPGGAFLTVRAIAGDNTDDELTTAQNTANAASGLY